MQTTLSYRHREISEDDLAFIRQLIADHPESSRRRLSKQLCEAWNWVQANGALRDMVCRGMMLMLRRAGRIELPPVRQITRLSTYEFAADGVIAAFQQICETANQALTATFFSGATTISETDRC